MKHLFPLTFLVLLMISTSCSKDDDPIIVEQSQENDQEQNDPVSEQETEEEEEEDFLSANFISDNVIIKGATKMDGALPVPNESITIDISNTRNEGFLREGFDIVLTSGSELIGAFIKFKSIDGTFSDTYYDVDIEKNEGTGSSILDKGSANSEKLKLGRLAFKDDPERIYLNINFTDAMPIGEFCYEIYAYDANGNISAPAEVCITVHDWAGDEDLLGEWNGIRTEFSNGEGGIEVDNYGEDCNLETLTCEGGSMEVEICRTSAVKLIFNADGTYDLVFTIDGTYADYQEFSETCEIVYNEYTSIDSYSGNWAYVNGDTVLFLSLRIFGENDEASDEPINEEETFEIGDRPLLLRVASGIVGDELIWIIDEDSLKVYFER